MLPVELKNTRPYIFLKILFLFVPHGTCIFLYQSTRRWEIIFRLFFIDRRN